MVTIEDVARECGVSPMTISRVVNGSTLVKESTRIKVLEAIERLGYHPNMIARSLANGKSKTIGVLSSNYYNQVYTDILYAIEEVAYSTGYNVINANVDDFEHAVNSFNIFLGNKVDGLIILPLEMNMLKISDHKDAMIETSKFLDYLYENVNKYNIPVVTVSQPVKDIFNIAFDFKGLAQKAMETLFEKGYKDISMINSIYQDGLFAAKEEVYRSFMHEKGLDKYINVEYDIALIDGGNRAMEKILAKRMPRAVFCANDYIAIGALQAINKRRIIVPSEIAVIGNDNAYFCEMTAPKLTTISLNAQLAGKSAMECLLKLINGEQLMENEIILPVNEILRESI